MARVCPSCHFESAVDSAYCPACGAPMDGGEAPREPADARLLPMRWHKFVVYFILPLSLALNLYNLIASWRETAAMDLSAAAPETLGLLKTVLYLGPAVQLLLIPLMLYAELGLVRMRWRGVRALLCLYAVNGIYAVVAAYLLTRLGLPLPAEMMASAAEAALMVALNRIYYRKRRALFFPAEGNGGEN